MLDGYAKKNFASNRELNIETIISNFENEIGTSQFKTQNYKQFIDKTEEVCDFKNILIRSIINRTFFQLAVNNSNQ